MALLSAGTRSHRSLPTRLLTRRADLALPLLTAAAALVLIYAATRGSTLIALVAVGAAAVVALAAVLGVERTGVLFVGAAFFTAPFYKGAAPSPGSVVTATDGLLLVGFVLLVPRLIGGRVQIPAGYLAGAFVVFSTGLIAGVLSDVVGKSLVGVVFWMVVLIGLPVVFSLWRPSSRLIDGLAMTFIAGQIFSFAAGLAKGNAALGRQAGLATQPNYLGQAALLSLALLLYLAPRYLRRSTAWATVYVGAAVIVLASLVMSGSRAATAVAAVIVLMVAIVERSAVIGFVVAVLVALGLVLLPLIISVAGADSSIGRLAGQGGASQASAVRSQGLSAGLDRYFAHPIFGSGLHDLFDIHNNYVEVLVAIGVFGFAGYLVVLYQLGRPLFGRGEHRRLAYVAWAYIGFGATVPSLYDRSVWSVLALATAGLWGLDRFGGHRQGEDDDPAAVPAITPAPTSALH